MRPRLRNSLAALGLALGAALLSACTEPDLPPLPSPASDDVRISASESAANVKDGGSLVVDFGRYNESVGDYWEIAVEGDPLVLGPGEMKQASLGKEGEEGASSELEFTFTAMGPGETTIEFQYTNRNEAGDPPKDLPARVVIDVTVE